jgi:hypothetical protein
MRWKGSAKNWIWGRQLVGKENYRAYIYHYVPADKDYEADIIGGIGAL